MTAVLNHDTLEHAIVHRVAERLDHRDLPGALIGQAYEDVIDRDPSLGDAFRADLVAVVDRDPACLRLIEPLLYFKGFHALQTHRLAHALLKAGRRDFAMYLQSRSSSVFGVDINPAARIGKGLFFDHATGLVVGETCVIDDDVSILQGVTLGGTGHGNRRPHPKIRQGVLIGAGEDSRQYRNRLLRARRGGVGGAGPRASQQDRRWSAGAHCRRSRLRRALARHEPDPGGKGDRGLRIASVAMALRARPNWRSADGRGVSKRTLMRCGGPTIAGGQDGFTSEPSVICCDDNGQSPAVYCMPRSRRIHCGRCRRSGTGGRRASSALRRNPRAPR